MKPHLKLGTKAETLECAAPILQSGRVLPLFYFSRASWDESHEAILAALFLEVWANGFLIVRSSAFNEDQPGASLAGKYESVTVAALEKDIEAAIVRVFDSYGDLESNHQVLIQPVLHNPRATGVACSVEPSSGAPYRVVSWVDWPESSDSVTSGRDSALRTWYSVATGTETDLGLCEPVLSLILPLIHEIESLTGMMPFEIEFGIDAEGMAVLLQLRQLSICTKAIRTRHSDLIATLVSRLDTLNPRDARILGKGLLLSVMSDWNPAEMIGIRPLPLAQSLYRVLITDRVWAMQRHMYGYRDLRGIPLMIDLCGHAFIDVRASFSSFVPCSLTHETAERLVDGYVRRLIADPHLHDKIEFEVMLSCMTFDSTARVKALSEFGVHYSDCEQLVDSLKDLTNRIIWSDAPWKHELVKVEKLRSSRCQFAGAHPLSLVHTLLNLCRDFGTLPFAGLARCGFIAMELINSAVSSGIMRPEERNAFLSSLDTVTSRMRREFVAISRSDFLKRYGHLRPGTYDILSARYDEAPDLYFDWSKRGIHIPPPAPFTPTKDLCRRLDAALEAGGFGFNHSIFFAFAENAIWGREEAKFEFTRKLSDILLHLQVWGGKLGVTREDLAFVEVQDILNVPLSSLRQQRDAILHAADLGRQRYMDACAINLPALIRSSEDIKCFELINEEPNFITQKRVIGRVANIARGDTPENAIALISSADPGYDWIFTRNILGLVTAYGGSNSHMAIRCFELGVPAAIGCGAHRYEHISGARLVEIDAAARLISALP